MCLTVNIRDLASYDDSGVTGNPYCRVLEAGEYVFYLGTDVRSALPCARFKRAELTVVERPVSYTHLTLPTILLV